MSLRTACSPVLILVPLLLAACVPGAADPEGGRAASAINFGGRTFMEPPGSVLGCQIAYCIEGAGCHVCSGETMGCASFMGCVAFEDSQMGAGELCSQDGCIPSGCFPAFCTAEGLCTVCDDGIASTVDQCVNDPANPCRHVPIDGPDAMDAKDVIIPGPMDAVNWSELPTSRDAQEPDLLEPPDSLPEPDASSPSDLGSSSDTETPPDCVDCRLKCEDEAQKACEKGRMAQFPLLPPGWAKGKANHCDNGRHLGWLMGKHLGWLKKARGIIDWDNDVALPTCEEICNELCPPQAIE